MPHHTSRGFEFPGVNLLGSQLPCAKRLGRLSQYQRTSANFLDSGRAVNSSRRLRSLCPPFSPPFSPLITRSLVDNFGLLLQSSSALSLSKFYTRATYRINKWKAFCKLENRETKKIAMEKLQERTPAATRCPSLPPNRTFL